MFAIGLRAPPFPNAAPPRVFVCGDWLQVLTFDAVPYPAQVIYL